MSNPTTNEKGKLLGSFFGRLGSIEELARVLLGGAEISALLTFRGKPDISSRLDFSVRPAQIADGGDSRRSAIAMAMEAEKMHTMMVGDYAPGVALGRREMLLKGSPAGLASFIPMLDFAPMLYKEHLADLGIEPYRRSGAPTEISIAQKAVFKAVNGAAWLLGFCAGLLRYRLMENLSLFDLLDAMARGVRAADPRK